MKSAPFVPPKLPLEKDIFNQASVMNILIEASNNVTRYQTLLEHTKIDKDLLMSPIIKQEAVHSTKIEGTQATFDEVLEVEAESKKNSIDVQEVLNYNQALNEGIIALGQLPISTRLFKKLHATLLSGKVRGSNRNPGEYRETQNYIGQEGRSIESATFIPPEPQWVNDYMSNLEKYINESTDDLHDLVRAAIIHAQFETIHPFLDGNGRIGRILIPLYLFSKGIINYPNFFISEILERDKHKYYRFLNDTRYKQDWEQWITFFLECVNLQARKYIKLVEDINKLYQEDLQRATQLINSNNITNVMNAIYSMPIFKSKTITRMTGLSEATVRRYLNILDEHKIIFSNGRVRSKTYYYYSLLDLIR
jgi:Fic family protein